MAARFLIILFALFSQAFFIEPVLSAQSCRPSIKWEPSCDASKIPANNDNYRYSDLGSVDNGDGSASCRYSVKNCSVSSWVDHSCLTSWVDYGVPVVYQVIYQYYKCPSDSEYTKGKPPADLKCNCDNCKDKAGKTALGAGYYWKTDAKCSNLYKISKSCFSGCEADTGDISCPVANGVSNGKPVVYAKNTSAYIYNGSECSSDSQPGDTPEPSQSKPADSCGSGQGMASMNGKTVCFCPDGSKVPASGSCAPGSGQSSPSNGDGTGSDQSSPSSDQSSPSSDQSKPSEGQSSPQSEEADDSDAPLDQVESQDLKQYEVPSDLTLVSMISYSGACPAPLALPKGWGTVDFDLICRYALSLRSVIIAIAFCVAGYIVFGKNSGG